MKKPNRIPQGKSDGSGRISKGKQQEKSDAHQDRYADPVMFRVRRATQCAKCKEELWPGRMIKLVDGDDDQKVALCKVCSGAGELFYVPAGNAKLTRLLSKYSKQKHVVVRWASARKRYERQGVLVELEALNKAEAELGLPLTIDEEDNDANDAEDL
jgi:hypothetical protein